MQKVIQISNESPRDFQGFVITYLVVVKPLRIAEKQLNLLIQKLVYHEKIYLGRT